MLQDNDPALQAAKSALLGLEVFTQYEALGEQKRAKKQADLDQSSLKKSISIVSTAPLEIKAPPHSCESFRELFDMENR